MQRGGGGGRGLSPTLSTGWMACLVIMEDVAELYLPTAFRILRLVVQGQVPSRLGLHWPLLLPFPPSQDLERLGGSALPSSSPASLSIPSCATLPGGHPLLEPLEQSSLPAPSQGPLYCGEGLASSQQDKSLWVLTVPQLSLHPGGPRARGSPRRAQ